MSYQLLERLTEKVSLLEYKTEANDSFYNSGEFEELYQEVLELLYRVRDFEIDAFPFETATEKMKIVHHKMSKKFDSLAKRIKRIEENVEIEEEDETENTYED